MRNSGCRLFRNNPTYSRTLSRIRSVNQSVGPRKKRTTVIFIFVFKAICGHLHETREFLGGEADSLSAACYPHDQGNKLPVIFREPRIKAACGSDWNQRRY